MTENEVLQALVAFIKSKTSDMRFLKGGDKKVENDLVPPAVTKDGYRLRIILRNTVMIFHA